MKAIFISVYLKKTQCGKSLDARGVSYRSADLRRCRGAGPEGPDGCQAGRHVGRRLEELHRRLLIRSFTRPSRLTTLVSKKDYAGAIKEYTTELMLYPPEACTKPGRALQDTLQLAQAYAKPGDATRTK